MTVSRYIECVWPQSARPRIPYMKAFHVRISRKRFFEILILSTFLVEIFFSIWTWIFLSEFLSLFFHSSNPSTTPIRPVPDPYRRCNSTAWEVDGSNSPNICEFT